ncbi:MAG TPA: T9SS type A sorting domain-containing protein, partial [Rhodothermales bacterium]|nr:T9SS type A sorting domain-containing protein [Rhodothermales bacterium]
PVEIPLGARAVVGGTMTAAEVTMTWPTLANIPDTWTAQLLDRQTGAVIELRTETSYTFTLPAEGLLAPALEATTTTGLLPAGPTQMAAARGTTTDARLVLVFGPSATTGTEGLPTVYALHAIAPNPVGRAGTLVRFDMPEAANAQIEVYDMLGRRVAVLASGAHEAGRHAVRLDAEAIASGVYVVRMAAGDFVQAQRVTVTR